MTELLLLVLKMNSVAVRLHMTTEKVAALLELEVLPDLGNTRITVNYADAKVTGVPWCSFPLALLWCQLNSQGRAKV